jgi:NAD(P)-dependent dehydrogenase (short-subunit alcohol dehydrogenase family)
VTDHSPLIPASADDLSPGALFSLEGKVAIVTGASSGLGVAVARGLRAAGAQVAVVARRADRLTRLCDEIDALAIPCDLRDDAARMAIAGEVARELGPPTVLVNGAGGVEEIVGAESEPLESMAATLELNLVASYRLAQSCFAYQRDQGGGSTIFVGSIGGRVGIPNIPQASYAASKAGLTGLGVELAVQWARHNVRVNTLQPGFFRSEITEDLYDTERGRAWLARNTPLPVEAGPEEMVGAVLWLASDASRFVTGQTIVVDGGWTAR